MEKPSPAICVQTHKIFLLKRNAEQRYFVTRLVCSAVKSLRLQDDEYGLHKVLHSSLHIRAVFKAAVEGHIGPLLLCDLSLQPEHQQSGIIKRGAVHFFLAVEAIGGQRPVFGCAAGGDGDEAHHFAMRLKVPPLVVLW